MREILKRNRIIAIMRNVPMKDALSYGQAVAEGGIGAVEVALNSASALEQIRLLKEQLGSRVLIGAGTALSPELAADAVSAGADFLLSPSADEPVLEYCASRKIKLLPGVMTPSDVSLCLRYGFDTLKLFPAGDLPMGYIKSLKGPFDQTEYAAVGGVSKGNIKEFFKAGFLGVGIGGNLIPSELVSEGRWQEAVCSVREFTAAIE